MTFRRRRNSKPADDTKTFVYKMICPITDEIVYIGRTINIKSRFYYHLNVGFEFNKKANFVRDLKKINLIPKFEVIADFDSISKAEVFESMLIKKLKPRLNTKL